MGRIREATRWREALPTVALLLCVGLPKPAYASPSAKLTYVRGQGAEKCPDETMLRKEVAARLGFDVFFPWARRTVVAEITKGPRGFHARLQILSEEGVVLGVRAIDATSESCSDVAHALALAMSIAVDDFGLDDVPPPAPAPTLEQPPPAEPAPPATTPAAPPSESAPAPPAPSSPPPAEPPLRLSITVATQLSFEVAPVASAGFVGGFDIRVTRSLSVGIEARGDLPATGGGVETYVVTGALVPCFHSPSPGFACAVVTGGDFHETGVSGSPLARDAPYLALGPRVGVELPLGRRFFVAAHADAAFVVLRHTVDLNGTQAFRLPVVTPSLALGGGVFF